MEGASLYAMKDCGVTSVKTSRDEAGELLRIAGLKTHFFTRAGIVKAVDGIDVSIRSGEAVALVGESGCGKSVTALSVMNLVPPPGRIVEGRIWFGGEDLAGKSQEEMGRIRGSVISMAFQDPMASLNPVLTIGLQMTEMLRHHKRLSKEAARREAAALLREMGISGSERCLARYPHELSGGMRQRVTIAMAISCQPTLLILDEPTTALDVSVQAQIAEAIGNLRARLKPSIMLITHDLGVVAGLAERVTVMYAGRVVETGDVRSVYRRPLHPYTAGLLASIPRLDSRKGRLSSIPGKPPNPLSPVRGCSFHPRCERAMRVCAMLVPPMLDIPDGEDRRVACWLHHPAAKARTAVLGDGTR